MIEYLRRFFGIKKKSTLGNEPVGWSALAGLLEDLEAVAEEHEEVFDTGVRERLWEYLDSRFIEHRTGIPLPAEFGMFTPLGNQAVCEAFSRNTKNLDAIIQIFELNTVEKRRRTFTNPKLQSERGSRLDDFFGAP